MVEMRGIEPLSEKKSALVSPGAVYLQKMCIRDRVSAKRNSETDSSWLESTIGGCYLTLTPDYLLLFKLNTPFFADDNTPEHQGYIARYDLNGANRKVLVQLAPNEVIADGCIAFDTESIFYLTYYIQGNGEQSPFSLIKTNVTNGSKSIVCELDTDSRHFIVGTYKGMLILKNIINPVTLKPGISSEELRDMINEQIHEVVLVSPTGELQKVCQWHQGERSEMFYKDKMFYWDFAEQAMYQLDLESGISACLYTGTVTGKDGISYEELTLLSDPFDERILLSASIIDGGELKTANFAFDLKTNEFSELTLYEDQRAVRILAEGTDIFLVQRGLKEYPVLDYMPDGQEYITNMLLPNTFLINKSDYWQNIPNYISIKDYVYTND